MAQIDKKSGLGKGIRALLDTIDDEINIPKENYANAGQQSHGISRIPIDKIEVNPRQPRTDFDAQALQELAESIRLHDIIQPITVSKTGNDTYRLISGERRWRAAGMAGLTDIPAYVRLADDQQMLELALIENLQREDLNAIEIALSYKRLMEECDMTQEQVAERMKKERSSVANYVRLLKLPPDVQKAVRDGILSMGHARAIIGLSFVEQQLYVYHEVVDKHLSVRQTEQLVKTVADEKSREPGPLSTPPTRLAPAYRRIEDNMASHFATRVRLDRKKNGKGTILIEFYSDDDLERIMEKMNM
jgi:ParB family transcriptional regulator, chromosome partitioning protein